MTDVDEALPPLAVPDIALDDFGTLLLKLESHAHRAGWDRPVHFRVVYDHDAAGGATDRQFRRITPPEHEHAPVRHGRYTATTVFGPRVLYSLPNVPVWDQLRSLILGIAFRDPDPHEDDKTTGYITMMRDLFRQPGIVGFATVGEAWHNTEREHLDRAVAGKVNLGDVPSSVEVRIVYAIDLADRAHHVQRIRGAKPTLSVDVPMRGDFTTSMRILADMTTGRTPPPEKYGERYPTLSDVLTSGRWPTRMTEARAAGARPTKPDPGAT